MPLHLVTGRANAGKTGVVNERLLAALARGESPTLVLPSVADVRRASKEYAQKAPTGLSVSTLTRWADALWRLHGDGRRIVVTAARDAFVRRAIGEAAPAALSRVRDTPGFSALIARTVSVMTGVPDSRTFASTALCGVSDICERYAELIRETGLVEEGEAWRSLGADPPRLDGMIALNRFAELQEPAVALLEGLSRENEVVVALTWEDGFVPTRALDATVGRLQAVAASAAHVAQERTAAEIAELGDRLYDGVGGVRSRGDVKVGLAVGADAEAALVARFVAEATTSGVPAERIVVAFPDLGRVVHRVETALATEGITCEIDLVRPVAETPLGRSLDALLTLAAGGGDRGTALGVLLGPHSDVPAETAAAIDRGWRKERVVDQRRLLSALVQQEGFYLSTAAKAARELAGKSVDKTSGNLWQFLVDALLSASMVRSRARGRVSASELGADLERDAAAAHAIVRAVGEMASVEGAPFFASDLRAGLKTIVAGGTAGERKGSVLLTQISRLRSRRFDTVVLGGLTSEELPTTEADSLSGELRSLMSGAPLPNAEDSARFAFYLALSRAHNRLVLVRRDGDDRGGEVRPSMLFEEAIDAYRESSESTEWPAGAPPRERLNAADVAISAPVLTRARRELRKDAADGRCDLGAPERGVLRDPEVLRRLAAAEVFSATEIESYLQCPYRWFYERVVRPEEIDVEVDARAVGTIAHSLLKAFYDELPSALDAVRVTPANVAQALTLLERVVADKNPGAVADGLAEELDVARALRWVRAAIADDAHVLPGFVPSEHELSFGAPEQTPLALGGVRFAGRIDRVDQSREAVFVTDYKSARLVIGHDKFASEGKVQAVVYALAASEATGLAMAGSVYRSLRSRQMRGFWRPDLLGGGLAFGDERDAIDEERFGELVSEAAARVEWAVDGIRAGHVPREPAVKNACMFCVLAVQCEGSTR